MNHLGWCALGSGRCEERRGFEGEGVRGIGGGLRG